MSSPFQANKGGYLLVRMERDKYEQFVNGPGAFNLSLIIL